jgi:two-component system LytT family response regulator
MGRVAHGRSIPAGGTSAARLPLVIFVTAFDRYALRAFEVHALDYLLKPFEFDKLRQALQRARLEIGDKSSGHYEEQLLELVKEVAERGTSWNRIAVREEGRVRFVKPAEIDWLEAQGNYVRLHAGKRSYLIRERMNALETRLAPDKFLRISRSTLVNLEQVIEWQPLFHGDSVVILRDGTRLNLSRVYRENLQRLLGPVE